MFDLQSVHEISASSLSNITKDAKSKKAELSFFYPTSSYAVLHFNHVPSKYSERYSSYRVDTKSIANKYIPYGLGLMAHTRFTIWN